LYKIIQQTTLRRSNKQPVAPPLGFWLRQKLLTWRHIWCRSYKYL